MTMRRRANVSLLLLAILFVVALILKFQLQSPWWCDALLFIAEAGMIGALADWFAVTALFRHPLGIKSIPHTAIVPRNREKLIDGVVFLVEEQLLNKEMIAAQLQKVNISSLLVSLVDGKWNSKQAEQWLSVLLSIGARSVKSEQLADTANQYIQKKLRSTAAAPYLSKALAYAMEKKYDHMVMDKLIEAAQERVRQPDVKPAIVALLEQEKDKMMEKSGGGWLTKALFSIAQATNAVNFEDAADVIYRDLVLLLIQLKNPNHELRVLLSEQLQILVEKLADEKESPSVTIEQWKTQLLDELELTPTISQLIGHIKQQFSNQKDEDTQPFPQIQKWLLRFINTYWQWLKQDKQTLELVDQKIKHFISHLIAQEHVLIGKVVRSTLDEFTEDRLVQFIEDKVEIDLQRIRVNGALIGAAIGLVLYSILHGVYEPILIALGVM